MKGFKYTTVNHAVQIGVGGVNQNWRHVEIEVCGQYDYLSIADAKEFIDKLSEAVAIAEMNKGMPMKEVAFHGYEIDTRTPIEEVRSYPADTPEEVIQKEYEDWVWEMIGDYFTLEVDFK